MERVVRGTATTTATRDLGKGERLHRIVVMRLYSERLEE